MTAEDSGRAIPVPFAQVFKRIFLGRALLTEKLGSERLSNPVALGALAPDSISSTCYGTEQILVELVPAAGMAAFVLLLPITG
ncbi:MAG: DNA-binding protein, partial [Mycobacterium sp.]